MLQGMESAERLDLIISFTSIRSKPQIEALHRHFVKGNDLSTSAVFSSVELSNLQRSVDKVQEVDAKIEKIKELDWSRFKSVK